MDYLKEKCMLWALQVTKSKPVKSMKLHMRLDHELITSGRVGGYPKGHPLMRSKTSDTYLGNVGTIYWIIGTSSV